MGGADHGGLRVTAGARRPPDEAPAGRPARVLPSRRSTASLAVAASAILVVGGGISLPPDLDTWAPAALPGEPVFALAATSGGILVGSGRGLYLLGVDGSVADLGVRSRVNALVQTSGGLLVGTADGLVALPDGGTAPSAGLPKPHATGPGRVEVLALAAGNGVAWAGTATGLYEGTAAGRWQRTWPRSGQPGSPVPAVLAGSGTVLFARSDGLALYDDAAATARLVVPNVSVVSLSAAPDTTRLWAGLRGKPLLLTSTDGGRSWAPQADGLGFTAVNTVLADPADPDRLIAGGSGLANGAGNAGVQVSDDGGHSWRARQGELSNTHVFALLGRSEALRLRLHVPGLISSVQFALPVHTSRLYAGTNGGGVYSDRPANSLVNALSAARPVLRLVEPFLAGLILLACALAAYPRLARPGGDPRTRTPPADGPPRRGPPVREAPEARGRDPDRS